MVFGDDLPRDIRNRSKRRGPRMNARVPVTIQWDESAGPLGLAPGHTRVVNNYGCLLVSPKEINAQQRLSLINLSTRQVAQGIVVWKGTQRPDGWDLGVELVGANLDFWGVEL